MRERRVAPLRVPWQRNTQEIERSDALFFTIWVVPSKQFARFGQAVDNWIIANSVKQLCGACLVLEAARHELSENSADDGVLGGLKRTVGPILQARAVAKVDIPAKQHKAPLAANGGYAVR